MRWFRNLLFRRIANRVLIRLEYEIGVGTPTKVLAMALSLACYPQATFGDRGPYDLSVSHLKIMLQPACTPKLAQNYIMKWIDQEISTESVFAYLWQQTPAEVLTEFFGRFEEPKSRQLPFKECCNLELDACGEADGNAAPTIP